LAEKRIALIELLAQLMDEQDKRQIELRKRLVSVWICLLSCISLFQFSMQLLQRKSLQVWY